ncbi:MAG: hypothetical protein PVF17_14005 [Ignavibacteria bacterium]|jgi:hypothetical protein
MKTTFKKLLSYSFLVSIICIVVLVPGTVNAKSQLPNNNPNKITQMTNKLAKKLLLSEQQKVTVSNILKEFFRNVSAAGNDVNKKRAARQNATMQILSLLDRKQKMKFDIIVNDWWAMAGV